MVINPVPLASRSPVLQPRRVSGIRPPSSSPQPLQEMNRFSHRGFASRTRTPPSSRPSHASTLGAWRRALGPWEQVILVGLLQNQHLSSWIRLGWAAGRQCSVRICAAVRASSIMVSTYQYLHLSS